MDAYKKDDGYKHFLCEVNQEKNHLKAKQNSRNKIEPIKIKQHISNFVTLDNHDSTLLHAMSQLVNNPSITIIPVKSNQHTGASINKHSPVSTCIQVVQVSDPTSNVSESCKNTTKNIKTKEIENSFKRIAASPISTRSEKLLKFSTELPKKDCVEISADSHYSNKISVLNKSESAKIKETISRCIDACSAEPFSWPSFINKVPPESTNPKQEKKSTYIDLTSCKLDSANIDETNKSLSPKQNQMAEDGCILNKRNRQNSRKVLKIEYDGESMSTSNTQIINNFVSDLCEKVESSGSSDKELQALINFLIAKFSDHGNSS